MSNRARREHTHALRCCLIPDPGPKITVRMYLHGRRVETRAEFKERLIRQAQGGGPSVTLFHPETAKQIRKL